jgi:osmotically-inducible protein OsmY
MTTVNRLFIVSTAFVCLAVVGCAATTTRDSTGQYFDDSAVTTKVKSALFNDPSLKSAEISVETFKGRVQLSGFVRSRANIEQALVDARGVSGVAAVENDMQLR